MVRKALWLRGPTRARRKTDPAFLHGEYEILPACALDRFSVDLFEQV